MSIETIEGFRLSPQQERLWRLDGSARAIPAQVAVRLEGPIDPRALRAASEALVARYEVLRTTYRCMPGLDLPIQVIADALPPAWRESDVSGVAELNGEIEDIDTDILVAGLLREERETPIDVENGPILRACLARLERERHVLILTTTALAADAAALDHMVRQIVARHNGANALEAADPVQYVDYCQWQSDLLESEEGRAAREYWRAAASSSGPPRSQSPSHSPSPARPFPSIGVRLDAAMMEALEQAVAQGQHSRDTLLLAAWQIVLWRIGLPPEEIAVFFDGRRIDHLRSAVGLFARYLPAACPLDGASCFADVCHRLAAAMRGAHTRQEFFPSDGLTADDGAACDFVNAFRYEVHPSPWRDGDLGASIVARHACVDRFRVELAAIVRDGGACTIEIRYDDGRADRAGIARLAERFATCLGAALREPDLALDRLDIIGPLERGELLHGWNETAIARADPDTVHEAFERQAAATPDVVAVADDAGGALTYRQLNERANRLARVLRRRGVGPDDRVGLLLPRSLDLAVGLLGILKAGGAYVPLDPAYPRDRLAYMLRDAGAGVIVTQTGFTTLLPGFEGPVVCLDAKTEAVDAVDADDAEDPHDLTHRVTADNLAYVIYTSGSTGRPKGVMVTHGSVANLALALRQAIETPSGRPLRVGLNAPITFDASVKQWLKWLDGHTLVLIPDDARRDGASLLDVARRQQLDLIDCTPAQLAFMLDGLEADDRGPRTFLAGGEAIDETLWRRLAAMRSRQFYNVYGPTECTVDATVERIAGERPTPAIGRPIANVRVYVTGASGRLTPAGIVGELSIGGAGVARGYLAQAALTADRFVPDCFGDSPGARLYRTGDLVRWRTDGRLEFVGRADHQVKIRGYRVELGEIQAALCECPGVQDVVVLAREDTPGDRRLVAYVVPAQPFGADAGEQARAFSERVRTSAKNRLPDFMRPAAVVVLDALPLTRHGKVDREALPAPDDLETMRGVAAETPVEEILLGIFQDVLRTEVPSVRHSFFELGGHSLLATQLISRVREAFTLDLPLRTIFEAPSIAALAAVVQAAWHQGEHAIVPPPIVRVSRAGDPPLSFAQQRLWFLDQLEPGSVTYNVPASVRLEGALDRGVLERTIAGVLGRHEVLRTSIHTVAGKPRLEIASALALRVPLIDLTDLPDEQRGRMADRLAMEEAERPFDLGEAPLFRVTLLRMRPDEHILLFTMHHVVSDAWSLGVLIGDVVALYRAYVNGDEPSLPELPVQYADYAAWQREYLRGDVLDRQLAYWTRRLEGAAPLTLSTDRPRPHLRSSRGGRHHLELSGEIAPGLAAVSRRAGVTMFMSVLAAFQTLLARYSAQRDIVVGAPIAARRFREIEPLIGFFVNPLALRTDLSGDPTFTQLLARVREVTLGAYAHQDLPFERLVDALQPERDLGRTPVFQVMLVWQNAPTAVLDLPGLRVIPFTRDTATSKFDLTLALGEQDGRLTGSIEYNSDLFDASTIARMAEQFEVLLAGIVADPDRRISALPLVPAAERQRLLLEWNDTARSYGPPSTHLLHELIERQAAREPHRIALVFEQESERQSERQSLTYGALNARANQLARHLRHLRQLGAGVESRIGVMMERSTEMVVALLASLKAGCAYVPLDPAYPERRLASMIGNADVQVLLTQRRLAPLAASFALPVVCVDADEPDFARQSTSNLAVQVDRRNAAYVIYTSGSTGTPKAAINTHEAICNRLLWMQEAYDLTAGDAVLQKTPFSFDVSVWEFFWPLLTGARLVVAKPGGHQDPTYLRELIERQRVTVVHFVPSMLGQFLAEEGIETSCRGLRLVVCSGEALSPRLQAQCFARLSARLENLYGPTEAAVDVTRWACRADRHEGLVPIGQPIANTSVYVLDEHGGIVPIGVPGELHLGGICLARGYCAAPALTAERFVPSPHGREEGARLYRTGDSVRHLPDGEIEYLGRLDEQVKVRGFRIELGEIVTALCQHARVEDAIVRVREDVPGDRRLIAYIAHGELPAPEPRELRQHLADRVPEYMIPSAFVMLEALPVTAHGKVDHRALPAPAARRSSEDAVIPPRTRAEKTLAAIWRDVLGLESVGVHDNFFEVGGDSILNIQIVARAKQAGLQLTPKLLFEHPTIARLAVVAKATGVPAPQGPDTGPITGPVELTPIQSWFFEQAFAEPHHWNQAVTVEAAEALDEGCLAAALRHLLDHHDALRLRFHRSDAGHWEQVSVGHAEIAPLVCENLSALTAPDQDAAMETHAAALQRSLDLAAGPLLAAALFTLGPDRGSRLLVAAHHLVVDAVSWRILLEDLQTIYRQLRTRQPVSLPAKTTAFAQWARRLRAHASSDTVEHEQTYWLTASRQSVATVPIDNADGVNDYGSMRSVSAALTAAETGDLLHAVPRKYRAQTTDLLLTALTQVIAQWTGRTAVAIDCEGHGREDARFDDVDLSRTVGWFTTLFPVVLEIAAAGGDRPGDDLKSIKEQLRQVPNRGFGHGLLRYLHAEPEVRESLRTMPRPDVRFNFLSRVAQAPAEGALFALAATAAGPLHAPRNRRTHLIDVTCGVGGDGRLRTTWTYGGNVHQRATIDALAAAFLEALRALVRHCLASEDAGYTPSDFPLAHLDQRQLDAVAGDDRGVEDLYPLSPMQEGMLLHALAGDPRGSTNVEQVCCLLRGPLDVPAFERAWQLLTERHSVLRSAFSWTHTDVPLQMVRQRVALPVACHDWRSLPHDEQQGQLKTFRRADKTRGFDLSQPVLMRLALLRVEDEAHYFVWTHHHLVSDGWSISALAAELFASYEELRERGTCSLEPGRPYRDYIAWLGAQDARQAERFWRDLLRGFTAPTPLVAATPASTVGGEARHGDVRIQLSEATTAILTRAARQHQITLNTIVQGMWALLLGHYSGDADVLCGVTVSGRPQELAGVESLIGPFINTLPLRIEVEAGATLASWLRAVQSRMMDMREYEYSRLVQQWSEVPLRRPLFDSLLVFENYPVDASLREQTYSLAIEDIRAGVQTKYPLTIVSAPGRTLRLLFSFDAGRFDEATIRTVAGHATQVLTAMATGFERSVADMVSDVPRLPVDREAASVPRAPEREAAPLVPPRTPIELALAGQWSSLLGIEHVSVTDNFFERGGHSLLATQLTSRIREAFGVELSLESVFAAPTIEGVAAAITAALDDAALDRGVLGGGAPGALPPIQPVDRSRPLPLSFAQQRLWFFDQLEPGSPAYNLPTIVAISGPLRADVLARTLTEVVRRHESLRTTFEGRDGTPAQIIHEPSRVPVPLVDLRMLPAAAQTLEADRLAGQEARDPFDLARGPLLRAHLLRLGQDEHRLLFTLHHIVADGWSIGVLVAEVTALYDAFVNGRPSPLGDLAIQYGDYAVWQREWIQGEALREQVDYWRRQLAGAGAPRRIVSDEIGDEECDESGPGEVGQGDAAAQYDFSLKAELSDRIRSFTRGEGVTLYMTLLAGFHALLHRVRHWDDIVVGTAVANRRDAATEPLIGFFVNMLAMRPDLSGDPPFRTFLQRVRRTALGAFAHQDVPFEKLVEELRPERGAGGAPFFTMAFGVQNAPSHELTLPGLSLRVLSKERVPARFDLTLWMADRGGGIAGHWTYRPHVISAAAIETFTKRYETLLASALADPGARLSALDCGHDDDRRHMARGREATRPHFAAHRPVPVRVSTT